jgi:homoserine dehydrogenase
MPDTFRVAIAGLGTVGTGVVRAFSENGKHIAARAGRPVEIVAVSARDGSKDSGVDLSGYEWHDDPLELASLENCDAVVELIGGEEGLAKELVEKALGAGKDVVTANKALLARHGLELTKTAENSGAVLSYEAAVAGGIPIIKKIRESYVANRIDAVYGILNGTCNYILSEMKTSGKSFRDVLEEAQKMGYAEADPSLDVDGLDAAHKLALLAALAFGIRPDFDRLRVSGIRRITAEDISYAGKLGYTIKLLGIARRVIDREDSESAERIVQMVEPCLVTQNGTIGSLGGVYNAVQVNGDFIGETVSIGKGAGAGPTASSVISDIVDLAGGRRMPFWGLPVSELAEAEWADTGRLRNRFYLRLNVLDKPGVLADIAAILRDNDISIESLIQHGRDPGQPVTVVLTTHEAQQSDIARACETVSAHSSIIEPPCALRIEEL